MKNIGFFYNADIRNNGTARRLWDAYVRAGGKAAGGARYTRPIPQKHAEHDLYIFVDDGRDEIPMEPPGPSACWLVDTHLGWDTRRTWAEKFDYVFCAQKPAADRMREEGLNAHWLPLACHPHVDPCRGEFLQDGRVEQTAGPFGIDKIHDLAFVGFFQAIAHPGQNDRLEFLDRMFAEFPNSWLGNGVFFWEAAARYVRARVGLNISILDDLNMRFFEVQSYGTCLLTNRNVVGWQDLGFEEDGHFVGYESIEEAIDKARYLLKNPCEREKIARRGHLFVRSAHTYGHRLEQILETVSK